MEQPAFATSESSSALAFSEMLGVVVLLEEAGLVVVLLVAAAVVVLLVVEEPEVVVLLALGVLGLEADVTVSVAQAVSDPKSSNPVIIARVFRMVTIFSSVNSHMKSARGGLRMSDATVDQYVSNITGG